MPSNETDPETALMLHFTAAEHWAVVSCECDPAEFGLSDSEECASVLGGGTAGARDWASSRPNLLNVAASRAKARFYVVGDRKDWSRRRFFDVLSKNLH